MFYLTKRRQPLPRKLYQNDKTYLEEKNLLLGFVQNLKSNFLFLIKTTTPFLMTWNKKITFTPPEIHLKYLLSIFYVFYFLII